MTSIDTRYTKGAMLAAAVLLAACGGSNHNAATSDTAMGQPAAAGMSTGAMSAASATPAGSTATATSATPQMTDANIIAAEEGGDSAEVVIATYARSHANSAGVRSYATMLVNDHGKSLRQTKALASKLNITPQAPPNDTTAQETAHTVATLQSLHGAALDSMFVNHEVQDHQHDISEAHTMAADAQNAQVKSMVQQSLPVLQKHLDRAQQLANYK